MKRSAFLFLVIVLLLTSCTGPSDEEIGQSVLSVAPIVFLVSIGFQYLFFRIWKRKWEELTMVWRPNLIFLIALIFMALLFRKMELFPLALVMFGTSYLVVLFLVTRIWLFFDHTNVFTWASVLTMALYLLPAFPMVAGVTEDTLFSDLILFLWILPGSILGPVLPSSDIGSSGVSTAIVLLVLLVEAWFATRKKAGEPSA